MGCEVQTPSPQPLLRVPSLSASSLSRTGAWRLPGALPLGKRAHEGPLSPGHPQTASALPPKENWLWGSVWLHLDLISSLSRIREWGFLSKVKEGVGRLEISAGEGRLLPQVGRAHPGPKVKVGGRRGRPWLREAVQVQSHRRRSSASPSSDGAGDWGLLLHRIMSQGVGRVETSREGPGGLSLEQSPREAPPKQPHSQRAASQLLFFFFNQKKAPFG